MTSYRSGLSLGILGGGQLGKMLSLAAADLHISSIVLDTSPDCPASIACSKFIQGDFREYDAVYHFGQMADVITIEIENVNTDALIRLAEEGKIVHPNPQVIRIIQDKGLQKNFYAEKKLKSPDYILCDNAAQVRKLIAEGKISFPFVQKSRKAGYDGRGVAVINSSAELSLLMNVPCVIEKKIAIKKELSVIAARNIHGDTKCFPPVEMIFDTRANLVKYLISPAEIENKIALKAEQLAKAVIEAFGISGVLAVEMFLDENDELLINEVAPRPHNSGHHTIESAYTSQYEQHLRAIFGFPLGSTALITPSVMLNLLGEEGFSGEAKYIGLEKCLETEGAKIHIYGKKETKPFRKMGHITILDKSIEGAKKKAENIMQHIKIIA